MTREDSSSGKSREGEKRGSNALRISSRTRNHFGEAYSKLESIIGLGGGAKERGEKLRSGHERTRASSFMEISMRDSGRDRGFFGEGRVN